MMSRGRTFENAVSDFFKDVFPKMGFLIIKVRKQKSGTQNGFDIRVTFLDENDLERNLFFECKDYTTQLRWEKLLVKVHELNSVSYKPDGFIGISPKYQISNIDDNTIQKDEELFGFPIEIWDTDNNVEEFFSLDEQIHQRIYGTPTVDVDESVILRSWSIRIKSILSRKLMLSLTNKIEIPEATRDPNENMQFRSNLDQKLNSVVDPDDVDRIEYHKLRCDYKVYLENLEDSDNALRQDILMWQSNMRIKAKRLTKFFQIDPDYTPQKFFADFFKAAQNSLLIFMGDEKYCGDIEKL